MPKPVTIKGIDPKDIFLLARGFHLADAILGNTDFSQNPSMGADLAQPAMVISALNSELFLKCIICIETGEVPTGHNLDVLFNKVSPETRDRIQHMWDTEVVPLRSAMWAKIEAQLTEHGPIKKDLHSALAAGSRSFERIRYSYEPNNKGGRFYISDLPRILGRVILQLKPEWEHLRRPVKELSNPLRA